MKKNRATESRLSRRRSVVVTAAALAAVTALVGCAADEEGGGAAAESDDPIMIGGSLGLTGVYSGPSAAYQVAYQYWADEVNENGGILGREVELRIYDDESTPQVAQQLYQQLINEDGADILLAPYTTAVGGAVVPVTERADKLVVNAGFVGKELHGNSDLMVSTWAYQESEYARPLFEWIATLPEDERPETLALLTAQNPFTIVAREGVDGQDGVLNYAEELGIEVVLDEEYPEAATDLASLIQRAAQADADMLVALSLPNDAALIANTVHQSDYNPMIYCQCGSQVTSLPNWPDLGAAGINVFATTTAWETQDNEGLEEFNEYLLEELDIPVLPAYGATAYAAGQVIQQAIEGTESLDAHTLREYIANNTFSTAAGELEYNDDGTVQFAALLLQYQEGGNQLIWPTEAATGEAVVPLNNK